MKTKLLISIFMITSLVVKSQSDWTVCNSPTTAKLQSVFMPEANKILIGGESGVLLMSTDYGDTFTPVTLGTTEDINAIYFFNNTNGIMLMGSNFMKTTDGGSTWSFVSNIPGNAKAFHFLNENTGYVACDLGLAFSTVNGGLAWNSLTTGVTERLEAVFFNSFADGFFGGRNSTSLHTTDQGVSFTANVIPANGDVKDIQFVSTSNGYSCGDNGEVLLTTNGGSAWNIQLTPNTNVDMDALHFVDMQNGWCSGEAGIMFHTTNGGSAWFLDNTNTFEEINNVHLFDNTHGFGVCDNGVIIRLGDGSVSINNPSLVDADELTISPNPVSGKFIVQSSLYGLDSYLSILDLTGKEIYTTRILQSALSLDTQKIKLASGLYICKIQSAENSKTLRLVVK